MTTRTVPTVRLPSREAIPVMGLGTWHMAENRARRRTEIDALRLGLDVGLRLIDTAEMYADGATEVLVGEAIAGRRDDVFLVSKVLPSHATYDGTVKACREAWSGWERTGSTSTCCTGVAGCPWRRRCSPSRS